MRAGCPLCNLPLCNLPLCNLPLCNLPLCNLPLCNMPLSNLLSHRLGLNKGRMMRYSVVPQSQVSLYYFMNAIAGFQSGLL